MCVCVCVCVDVSDCKYCGFLLKRDRQTEGEREREDEEETEKRWGERELDGVGWRRGG